MSKLDGMDPQLVRTLLTEVQHAAKQMDTIEVQVAHATRSAGVPAPTTHRPSEVADACRGMVRDVGSRLTLLEKKEKDPVKQPDPKPESQQPKDHKPEEPKSQEPQEPKSQEPKPQEPQHKHELPQDTETKDQPTDQPKDQHKDQPEKPKSEPASDKSDKQEPQPPTKSSTETEPDTGFSLD